MIARIALTSETKAAMIAKAAIKKRLTRIMKAGFTSNCVSEGFPQSRGGCNGYVLCFERRKAKVSRVYTQEESGMFLMMWPLRLGKNTLGRGNPPPSCFQCPLCSLRKTVQATRRVSCWVMLITTALKYPPVPLNFIAETLVFATGDITNACNCTHLWLIIESPCKHQRIEA
jgi:hypothetical protein